MKQFEAMEKASLLTLSTLPSFDDMMEAIVKELAPAPMARNSIGLNSPAHLLLIAWDNSERLRSISGHAAQKALQ